MDDDDDSKRLSYLVSALVHLSVILVVSSIRMAMPPAPTPEPSPTIIRRVRLVAPPSDGPSLPTPPPPTPPPPTPPRDEISIGAESELRKRLILERDVDITNERIGPGYPGPRAARAGAPSAPPSDTPPLSGGRVGDPVSMDGGDAARVPPGRSRLQVPVGPPDSGLRQALRDIDRRIGTGEGAVVQGGGQKMGPLQFNPRGADFTAWVNHWRREVYRNWIIPQPALLGLRGHVDLEFTVARDGTVTNLRILKGSGVSAFDKSSANSILASRLLRLPADYAPDSVTMQATFYYNEDPQDS